jgi:hypothetical protein
VTCENHCCVTFVAFIIYGFFRLTDALVDDILNDAADELEGIFAELADKFIDKI